MRDVTLALMCVVAVGCGEATTQTPNAAGPVVVETRKPVAPDNTAVNLRDRDSAAKTPIDQNENQADVDVTAGIRKRIVDTKMSVGAQNVKIITQDGKVTLRGPVSSAEEKELIEKIALDVAGSGNVDSQLEIQSTP